MSEFNTTKRKLGKIWNRNQDNTDNIIDLGRITVNFNSINFYKNNIKIPIITDQVITSTSGIVELFLEDFPESFLNLLQPTSIWTIDDGWNTGIWVSSFSQAAQAGTLKNGDLSISSSRFDYWYNRIDGRHFNIKIFYGINIRSAVNVNPPFFGSVRVPTTINIFLKIINEYLYENINQQKI